MIIRKAFLKVAINDGWFDADANDKKSENKIYNSIRSRQLVTFVFAVLAGMMSVGMSLILMKGLSGFLSACWRQSVDWVSCGGFDRHRYWGVWCYCGCLFFRYLIPVVCHI